MAAETVVAAGSQIQAQSTISAGSEAQTDSAMQSQIEAQVQALAAEKIKSEQTQKTNLEEHNHHKHHVSKGSMHVQLSCNCVKSYFDHFSSFIFTYSKNK